MGDWILCSKRMPDERYSDFAILKGTDKWKDTMVEKLSDYVNVTVEFADGFKEVKTIRTIDGKWSMPFGTKGKVIAWKPLPEPYKEGDQT